MSKDRIVRLRYYREMLSLILAAVIADATPMPAAPAPSPRFAVVIGRANPPLEQPAYDRWANTIATRFADRFAVTAVPIPSDERPSPATPGMCNTLGVVGFIWPWRQWHISSATMRVLVGLTIFDCDGDQFFYDSSTLTEKRDHAMIAQAQIDSIASHATGALLAKFAQFESGHRALWSRLIATGALRQVSPTPYPTASP